MEIMINPPGKVGMQMFYSQEEKAEAPLAALARLSEYLLAEAKYTPHVVKNKLKAANFYESSGDWCWPKDKGKNPNINIINLQYSFSPDEGFTAAALRMTNGEELCSMPSDLEDAQSREQWLIDLVEHIEGVPVTGDIEQVRAALADVLSVSVAEDV